MNDINITPQMLALIPVVAALIQITKKIPKSDIIKPYLPFIGMIIAFGLLYVQSNQVQIIEAITIGAITSGTFDSFKALTNGGK